jgi:hypothetical protein
VIVHACDGTPSRCGVLFAEEYVFAFFYKPGFYFTGNSSSLHHTTYKDTLGKNKDYKQVLVRSSRSFSPPAAGGDALKPAAFPAKQLQVFQWHPKYHIRETNML